MNWDRETRSGTIVQITKLWTLFSPKALFFDKNICSCDFKLADFVHSKVFVYEVTRIRISISSRNHHTVARTPALVLQAVTAILKYMTSAANSGLYDLVIQSAGNFVFTDCKNSLFLKKWVFLIVDVGHYFHGMVNIQSCFWLCRREEQDLKCVFFYISETCAKISAWTHIDGINISF